MNGKSESIAVIGAGSWGTALGILLARHGNRVRIWGHETEAMRQLQAERENRHYLPGIPFPDTLEPMLGLAETLDGTREILIVVPSHAFTSVLEQIHRLNPEPASLSWATKGLEPGRRRLLHEAASEVFPNTSLAVVSGPTFAMEVARGLPTAVTVASPDPEHAGRLAGYLHGDTFRAYTASDITGVEVGGAAKNVMAIAAGISDGLGFGANARAALITRGLAEITRLGLALGGEHDTFMGLAGLGDLVLTCTDNQSRNRRMGLALAEGHSIQEAREAIGQEVEGLAAARDFRLKADELGVEMPITQAVFKVLYEGLEPGAAVKSLLARDPREEQESRSA
ncbi:MAG: glycerol-3-phosphate dehydrogenase [Gammaproteobacteria bacterium]|nr:MAG: glycerol-3-phosphate dehydrogenase [Gammaproteobacteria bacterium]RTZ73989.1 MAG: glycerol-3-phosphate dehydrogenase [Gammaproteobacteria bacterium]